MTARAARLSAAWKFLRPMLRDNIGLKLLAFACAIVLFGYVHGTQNAQRIMAVDLVALLPPANENRVLTSDLPTSVRVSLHGPRSLVSDLRSEDLGTLQLDLRSAKPGRIPLEPSMLNIPGGVVVDSIDPPSVDIAWDEVVTRDVNVQVFVTGEPMDGFAVKSQPTVDPQTVRATGPRQIVDALRVARAEPFDVSGVGEGIHTRTLSLDRPPRRVQYDHHTVTATVEITRKLIERMFSKVRVQVVGTNHAETLPATVDVRVVGPPDIIKALRADQIVPRVTVSELGANLARPNSVALPVVLELDNVDVSIVPKTVIVKW